MVEHELKQKLQAGELAADNGTLIRALALVGNDYQYTRLRSLHLALAGGMSRGAMYLDVRTAEGHAAASVSDVPLEELEAKLTPKGAQLQRGVLKDPLVDL